MVLQSASHNVYNVHTSSPIWGTKGDFLGMTSVIHGEGLNSLDTSLLMDGLTFGR